MARVYPLFSSSKGNAVYIGNEKSGILIDAGVSCKKLVKALALNGISPEAVRGIFITHEHIDHIRGLKIFTKYFKTPVFAESKNLEYLISSDMISSDSAVYDIENRRIECCGYLIHSFSTPHDTRQSCGFRISTPDAKVICTCTDLGEITETVHKNLAGSDLVLLEANYDETMLRNGPYPYMLKKRISSKFGHLSNKDSAEEIEKLLNLGTQRVILGHLSQENNTPGIAFNTISNQLSGFKCGVDYILKVAPVETEGEVTVL